MKEENIKSIYFSETMVDKNIERNQGYKKVEQLKTLLQKYYILIETKDNDFDGYGKIEKSINNVDGFIAIYDEFWSSSTWRCSELTFAAGFTTIFSKNKVLNKIPVYVYLGNPNYEIKDWIERDYNILPNDVNEAIKVILKNIAPAST